MLNPALTKIYLFKLDARACAEAMLSIFTGARLDDDVKPPSSFVGALLDETVNPISSLTGFLMEVFVNPPPKESKDEVSP